MEKVFLNVSMTMEDLVVWDDFSTHQYPTCFRAYTFGFPIGVHWWGTGTSLTMGPRVIHRIHGTIVYLPAFIWLIFMVN